jgi:hypothetical protein
VFEYTKARKRGGQAGNTNAVKHGIYSQTFTDLEAADLQSVVSMDLDGWLWQGAEAPGTLGVGFFHRTMDKISRCAVKN